MTVLLTLICAGCVTTDQRDARVGTNLPPRPSYMAPVPVPQYTLGQQPRAALGATKQALTKANKRLVKSGEFYDDLRKGVAQ